VRGLTDENLKDFWKYEFAKAGDYQKVKMISPITNKIGRFLFSPTAKRILEQGKSTINFDSIMNQGKILLCNLSKGKIGEDNSEVFGVLIMAKIQLAALKRARMKQEDRKDFYLYVDEFQNFVTESFATILSEARKYRLNLTIGHQYIGQLTPDKNSTKVRDAVFGNVGTIVSFRIGAADAEFLETEFEPVFTPNDIVNLPKYQVVLKLMINGVTSEPFSAITLPPNKAFYTGNGEKVIKVSRERFANGARDVEEKIARWMGSDFHEQQAMVIGDGTDRALEQDDSELAPERTESLPQATKPAEEAESAVPKAEPVVQATTVPTQKKEGTLILAAKPSPEVPPPAQKPAKWQPRPSSGQHERTFPQRPQGQGPRNDGNRRPMQQRPSMPKHPKPAGKKNTNPIWDTVANLNHEKNEQVAQHVSKAVAQAVKPSTAPTQPSVEQASEVTTESHVIKPGEKHTF
jgi:hypothetical protein